jgi:anti-anti-sigma factor
VALPDYVTIQSEGQHDIGVARLRAEPTLGTQLDEVCEAVQQDPSLSLILDFSHVDYVSEGSGRHLLRLLKTLRDAGYALHLANVAKPTHDMLESMGLTDIVPIMDAEDS